jgi:hypothetical protein
MNPPGYSTPVAVACMLVAVGPAGPLGGPPHAERAATESRPPEVFGIQQDPRLEVRGQERVHARHVWTRRAHRFDSGRRLAASSGARAACLIAVRGSPSRQTRWSSSRRPGDGARGDACRRAGRSAGHGLRPRRRDALHHRRSGDGPGGLDAADLGRRGKPVHGRGPVARPRRLRGHEDRADSCLARVLARRLVRRLGAVRRRLDRPASTRSRDGDEPSGRGACARKAQPATAQQWGAGERAATRRRRPSRGGRPARTPRAAEHGPPVAAPGHVAAPPAAARRLHAAHPTPAGAHEPSKPRVTPRATRPSDHKASNHRSPPARGSSFVAGGTFIPLILVALLAVVALEALHGMRRRA